MDFVDSEVSSIGQENFSGEFTLGDSYPTTAELGATEWFRNTFLSVCDHNEVLTIKEFKQVINKDVKTFAKHLFALLDSNCSGNISLERLIDAFTQVALDDKSVKSLTWFQKAFTSILENDQSIELDQFEAVFVISEFVENLFFLLSNSNDRTSVSTVIERLQRMTSDDTDAKWLLSLKQHFLGVTGADASINFEEFKKALNIQGSTFFADRLFQLFDTDKSGTISVQELVNGLSILIQGNQKEKLKFLFMVYDVDGNGFIDFEELKTVLKSCMNDSGFKLSDDNIIDLTRTLFESADADNSGTITFEELKNELDKHPGVVENLTFSAANWLRPTEHSRRRYIDYVHIPHCLKWKYVRNNIPLVIYIMIWITANCIMFVEAGVRHSNKGIFVSIARGCGQCLNFNPTIVLVLMMRKCMTWLRSTRFGGLLPLDHYIELHKMTGYSIVLFSCVHFFAHLANFSHIEIESVETNYTMWMYLFGVGTNLGWVGGTAGLTGWLLLIILTVIVICSLPVIRRSGHFQIFHWTHNMFVIWYIILILHAASFWKWIIVPAFVYTCEYILRMKIIKLVQYGKTYIEDGILLPSKVIHLIISRPHNFSYNPGDYVFIQIPSVAKYEWHPFTISSAPEKQGVFWLHIRAVGTWTERLYNVFETKKKHERKSELPLQLLCQPQKHHFINKIIPLGHTAIEEHPMAAPNKLQEESLSTNQQDQDSEHEENSHVVMHVEVDNENEEAIQVYIDGPYGSPSAHIFQAEHAVLIGAGIGVTPFASILQSIMLRYRNARQVCPRCNHGWTGNIPATIMRLRKVEFYWINRHQKYFEWFVSLLSQLEIEQCESGFDRFLDMHMYITSALAKTDMKAIGLQMALDLIHKKEKRDLITGLKTRTEAGRPNWDKVFEKLNSDKQGKVTVFYCGLPTLGSVLRKYCVKYGFEFRKENF